jgi:Stress responsive A/B Barrel Domain
VTVHLVDQQQVASGDADAFTALIREQGAPLMERAGARFVSCDASTPGPGGLVDVLSVWSFDDFVAWNRIRRDLLFDPGYGPYTAALVALRRSGARRFYPRGPMPDARDAPDDPAPDHLEPDHLEPDGPALRRWEMFSLDPTAPRTAVDAMRRAMQECDAHIAGITRNAVGTNTAGPPIDVVWGTTYASVAAYRHYMTHPYHASVLDRFLLPDCPERITTHNALGAGLIGYATDRPEPAAPVAVRRLLLLDFDARADAAVRASDDVEAAGAGDLLESVLAENTMSTRWFDGETDMGGRPAWTHLWDQCFASAADLDRHRAGHGPAATVEGSVTAAAARAAEIVYAPEDTVRS